MLTSIERKSQDNAIWLCQNCAKLVDNDPRQYHVGLLRRWKEVSEEAALLAIASPSEGLDKAMRDEEIIRFFVQCFDRPAFQDPFLQEGSIEAFDRAIEDTITAINTGCLRSRDGAVLSRVWGKAFLQKHDWREQMDAIVDLLRAIRSRYAIGISQKEIWIGENDGIKTWHCINNRQLSNWMDQTRAEALALFSKVAKDAGVLAHSFPGQRSY